jgi:hypothetical protein
MCHASPRWDGDGTMEGPQALLSSVKELKDRAQSRACIFAADSVQCIFPNRSKAQRDAANPKREVTCQRYLEALLVWREVYQALPAFETPQELELELVRALHSSTREYVEKEGRAVEAYAEFLVQCMQGMVQGPAAEADTAAPTAKTISAAHTACKKELDEIKNSFKANNTVGLSQQLTGQLEGWERSGAGIGGDLLQAAERYSGVQQLVGAFYTFMLFPPLPEEEDKKKHDKLSKLLRKALQEKK